MSQEAHELTNGQNRVCWMNINGASRPIDVTTRAGFWPITYLFTLIFRGLAWINQANLGANVRDITRTPDPGIWAGSQGAGSMRRASS